MMISTHKSVKIHILGNKVKNCLQVAEKICKALISNFVSSAVLGRGRGTNL